MRGASDRPGGGSHAPDGRSMISIARRVSLPPPSSGEHGPAAPGTSYLGDRYRVVRLIGEGGFARVYLAIDEQLQREVALKELNESGLASQEILERFQNEARAAAMLKHDAIVQVYDVFDDPRRGPVMVMEYAPGGDLTTLVDSGGPLPPLRAAWMFERVAAALAEAHANGIIHRDVKPQNILLTAGGDPKLTDFGIARLELPASREITQSQMQMGTPDYMAPEIMLGAANATPLSDLYALGASLYFAVTGSRPRVVRVDAVPAQLRAVVSRCMADDPAQRYASATELADVLRAVADAISGAERRLIPPVVYAGVSRKAMIALAAAASVAGLAGLAALRLWPPAAPEIDVAPLVIEHAPMPVIAAAEPVVHAEGPARARSRRAAAKASKPRAQEPREARSAAPPSAAASCIANLQSAVESRRSKLASSDLDCLRDVEASAGEYVPARVLLARGLTRLEKYRDAETILEATALDPRGAQDPDVLLRLAQVLSKSKNQSRLKRCVRRADLAWTLRGRVPEDGKKRLRASLEAKRVSAICAEKVVLGGGDSEYLGLALASYEVLERLAQDAGEEKVRAYAARRAAKLRVRAGG